MPDEIAQPAAQPVAKSVDQRARPTRTSNSSSSYRDGMGDTQGISDRSAQDRIAKLLNPKTAEPGGDRRTHYDDMSPEDRDAVDRDVDRGLPRGGDSHRVQDERDERDDRNEQSSANDNDDLPSSLDDDDDGSSQSPGNDYEEIEYEAPNGRKYVVPKALVDGAMMQSRFTQVMDQNAAERQFNAAFKASLEMDRSIFNELEPTNAQLRQIDATIEAYKKQLPNPNDPANIHAYITLDKQIRDLTDARAHLASAAADRRTELTAQKQALVGALQSAADAMLAKALPKWNERTKKVVVERLASSGYTPQEIQDMYDPRLIHLAHDAAMYHRIVERRSSTKRQVQAAPPVVRPAGRPSADQTEGSKTRTIVQAARKSGSTNDAVTALTSLLKSSRRRN